MLTKKLLTAFLVLFSSFCFSQNKEGELQTSLNELNTYLKNEFNKEIKVKDKKIYIYDNNKKSDEILQYWEEANIKDLFKVIKFPKDFKVVLPCKNAEFTNYCGKCYKQANNERKSIFSASNYGVYDFQFTCKSELKMDKLFDLFSNFWLNLTGIDSKTNYTNAEIIKIQEEVFKNEQIILLDYDKDETYSKSLKKHLNESVYVNYLYINNDLETYRGSIKLDNNCSSCSVNRIRIKAVIIDTTTIENKVAKRVIIDTTTVEYKVSKQAKELHDAFSTLLNNNKNNIYQEAKSELNKLEKDIIEYNNSMKMYISDCEKDKQWKNVMPYGKSTPCRNLVMYNEMIKSGIERYLKKYELYTNSDDVSKLKSMIKTAENNISQAKY